MKKTNNKGFSLVELIIVVAIMAILIGVLAPQYIKYVEKSRVSADENTADMILTSVQAALADEDYESALAGGETITFSATDISCPNATLKTAMEEYFGTNYTTKKIKSAKYKDKAPYTVVVTKQTSPKTGYIAVATWAK